MLRRRHVVIAVVVMVFASLFALSGTAAAVTGGIPPSIDCSTVTQRFVDLPLRDRPIYFFVSVQGGPFQRLTPTENPPGFDGEGTATADISSLTATLQGQSGTVAFYLTWAEGQTDTVTQTVVCGTAPPTTTTPPTTTAPPITTPPTTMEPPPQAMTDVVVLSAPPPATPIQTAPATAG
jgi:hypothetical protein